MNYLSFNCVSKHRVWRGCFNLIFVLLALGGLLLVTGCGEHQQSILDPQSPEAREIANLWWVMFGVCGVVFIAVLCFLGCALFGRPGSCAPGGSMRFVVIGGILLPAVVLTGFLIYSLRVSILITAPEDGLTIEVGGHQWWWEVRYPEAGIVTANEIHIPAGERVRIRLRSHDVIHSFWVPNLHGKMDLFPEEETTLWIQTEKPGIWRGQCAEFCGTQHALMGFEVIAHAPEDFVAWVQARQEAVETLENQVELDPRHALFLRHDCQSCHAIQGTQAQSNIGPDLTHLANRRKLASATLPNNSENLADFISNSQTIKPGNHMPATQIEYDELQQLVEYLYSLDETP